jgi:hypothetical protein
MREMCLSQSEAFLTKKKEQKNFIRAVQGICRNRCQYFDVLSQKNSMLYDMVTSLQHKKKDLTFFERSRSALEEQADDGPSRLQRQTDGSEQTGAVVHFYKNQHVSTPMGPGTITRIDVAEEKVTIQLPFGTMHSSFEAVVSWSPATLGGTALDVNHVSNLRQRWTRDLAAPSSGVGMTEKRSAETLQLLQADKQQVAATAAAAATAQHMEVVVEEEVKAKTSSKSRRSVNRSKESSAAPPTPLCLSSAETVPNPASRQADVQASIEASKRSIYLDHTKKLPLLFCPPGIAPYLVSTYSGDYSTQNSLARAKKHSDANSSSTQRNFAATSHLQAEYCLKAFERPEPVSFFCDMDSRGGEEDEEEDVLDEDSEAVQLLPDCRFNEYAKEVVDLKENLRPLLQKIKECRRRKRKLVHHVEHTKLSTAQISQQISKLRLGMFTRRVLYRQNLVARAEQEKAGTEAKEIPEAPASAPASVPDTTTSTATVTTDTADTTSSQPTSPPTVSEKAKVSPKEASSPEKLFEAVIDSSSEVQSEAHQGKSKSKGKGQSQSTRRKSTRAAVVATIASSDTLSTSRAKRKKDDVAKEEDANPAPAPSAAAVPSSSAAAPPANGSTARSSKSQSASAKTTTGTTLKRNPKRSRR